MVEPGHAGQPDLERDGDVSLDLLGGPPGRLDDDLDQRRHRVRIGLDLELAKGVEAADHQDRGREKHEARDAKRERVRDARSCRHLCGEALRYPLTRYLGAGGSRPPLPPQEPARVMIEQRWP